METEDVFVEFVLFCGAHLGNSKDILKLVNKRYKDCDPEFAASKEFLDLIQSTKDNIQTDSSRIFVHLKHFLNDLKDHKCLRASRADYPDRTESGSKVQRKGIKRSVDHEIPETTEQSLKHPRLTEPVNPHAIEEQETSFSDNELPNIIRKANTQNELKLTSTRCRSESPSVLHSDEGENTPPNWRDFKFKKSVMTSMQAAASSFRSKLRKTILKANNFKDRSSGSNSDCGRIGAGSVSSTSRTPSPEFQEKGVSNIKPSTNYADGDIIEESKSGDLKNQSNKNVESTGSTEISSTTSNLDSDTDGNYKQTHKSADDTCSLNFKKRRKVESQDDLVEITDYTIEMNTSSDEEDKDFDEVKNYLDKETVNFTASDSECNDMQNVSSESNKTNKQINISESNRSIKEINMSSGSDKCENRDKTILRETTEHFIINGIQMKERNIPNGKHSRSRHCSAKSQSSIILIETDDESSSDAEEMKSVKSESGDAKYESEVNALFEGSEDDVCSEKENDKTVKTVYCDDVNISEIEVKKPEYRRIPLTKVETIKDEEKDNHTSDDERNNDNSDEEERDQSFPELLGLISVKKLEEETGRMQEEKKLKTECRTRRGIVYVDKLEDEKLRLKYLGPTASTSSKDKGKDRQDKTKSGPVTGSQRQIQKYEELLTQIRDKIEEVRERELGLDDLEDEDSDYILEDKLKKKFVAVFKKLCELHKANTSTGRPTETFFRYEGTRYPEINRKITRFINKRKEFPDYQDIRKLIVKTNKSKGLNLRRNAIDELSREAFTDVGNRLQKRRHEDFMSTFTTPFSAPVSEYDDPALIDPVLKKKLDANKKDAKSRMDAVVEKYTRLQHEVGDRDLSDEDSDAINNEDNAAKEPGVHDKLLDEPELIEEEPDLILIEDDDTILRQGLGLGSRSSRDPAARNGFGLIPRSGRAPLLIESSQLEIARKARLFHARSTVNDEEEDIGPYFEETQVDNVGSPQPGTSYSQETRPRLSAYDNETLVMNDDDESLPEEKSEEQIESERSLSPDVLAVFKEGDEIEIMTDYSDSEDEMDKSRELQKLTDIKLKVENKDIKLKDVTNLKESGAVDTSMDASVSSSELTRIYIDDGNETAEKTLYESGDVKDLLSNEREKDGYPFSPEVVFIGKDDEKKDRVTEYIDDDLIDLAKQVSEKQHGSDSDSDVEIQDVENVNRSKSKTDNDRNTQNTMQPSKTESTNETQKLQSVHIQLDETSSVLPSVAADKVKKGSLSSNDSVFSGSHLQKSTSVDMDLIPLSEIAALPSTSHNFTVQKVKQFVEVLETNKIQNVLEKQESSDSVRTASSSILIETETPKDDKISEEQKQTAKVTQTQTTINSGQTVTSNSSNEKAGTTEKNSVDSTSKPVEITCIDRDHMERRRTDRSESPISCISIDSTEDIPVPETSVKPKVSMKPNVSGNLSSHSSLTVANPPKRSVQTKNIVSTKNNVQAVNIGTTKNKGPAKNVVQTKAWNSTSLQTYNSVQTKNVGSTRNSVRGLSGNLSHLTSSGNIVHPGKGNVLTKNINTSPTRNIWHAQNNVQTKARNISGILSPQSSVNIVQPRKDNGLTKNLSPIKNIGYAQNSVQTKNVGSTKNQSPQSSGNIVHPRKDNVVTKNIYTSPTKNFGHAQNSYQTKSWNNMYAKKNVQSKVMGSMSMHTNYSVQTKGNYLANSNVQAKCIMQGKDSIQSKNSVNKTTGTQAKTSPHTKNTINSTVQGRHNVQSKMDVNKSNSQAKTSQHTKNTVATVEDDDSDIEIIEEYNINDGYYDYYPEDNQAAYYGDNSSKKDSQGSNFTDYASSKNLNYSDGSYSYDESGLEWEEEEYRLDSTSSGTYANDSTAQYGTYEEEITSTFGDPADFKAPNKITKEQFRAACVKLKKPEVQRPSPSSLKKPEAQNPTPSQIRAIKQEASLDPIEIHDEPDSTPYEDEMEVSSSCQNELIVLSDSE